MACCCVIALISAKRGHTCQLWLVFSSHICSMMLLSMRIIIFVKPRLSAWITASLIAHNLMVFLIKFLTFLTCFGTHILMVIGQTTNALSRHSHFFYFFIVGYIWN
jgi:hypothetical protein